MAIRDTTTQTPEERKTGSSARRRRRPTWEVAYLFPRQGEWSEEDFLGLDSCYEGFPRVELCDGCLEVLPLPNEIHQLIAALFFRLLDAFTAVHAPGIVLFSGMRIRLKQGKKPRFRDADVVYLKAENFHLRHPKYWDGADLAMEVVSDDRKDQARDWDVKPREYAEAGIGEYWIIDPKKGQVRVLALQGGTYKVHGDFGPGMTATSALLPGFSIAVDQLLSPLGSQPSV